MREVWNCSSMLDIYCVCVCVCDGVSVCVCVCEIKLVIKSELFQSGNRINLELQVDHTKALIPA